MHTSAQSLMLEYGGTLVHHAEARTRVLDGQDHAVPVLCMDIELDNSLRNRMHIEQPFPPNQFTQAAAAAKRLKKGMHIVVHAPPVDMELIARNVSHVAITPEPSTDLFQEQST